MTATLITTAARQIALKIAKGDYQRGMIHGHNSWAGSDLKGTAARYGGRYRDSRENLVAALRKADLRVLVSPIGERGRLIATILTATEAKRVPVTAIGSDNRVEAHALQARIKSVEKKAAAAKRKLARQIAADETSLSELVA